MQFVAEYGNQLRLANSTVQGTQVEEVKFVADKIETLSDLEVNGTAIVDKLKVKSLDMTAGNITINATNLRIDEGDGNTTTILEYIMKLMYMNQDSGGGEG